MTCVCISLFQIRLTKHCNSIQTSPHTQTAPVAAAPAPAVAGGFEYGEYDDKLWDQDAKKDVYNKWDPNSPRSARNFNPFETYKGNSPDASGIYPGEVSFSFLFLLLFGFVCLHLSLATWIYLFILDTYKPTPNFLSLSLWLISFLPNKKNIAPIQGSSTRRPKLPNHVGREGRRRGSCRQSQGRSRVRRMQKLIKKNRVFYDLVPTGVFLWIYLWLISREREEKNCLPFLFARSLFQER